MASPSGFLYAFRIVGTDLVKIGYTRGAIRTRLDTLQCGQPHTLEVAATLYVTSRIQQCEKAVHTVLAPHQHRGEWFTLEMTPESFFTLVSAATAQWEDVTVLPDAPPPPPYKPFLDVEGTDFDLDFDLGMHDDAPPPLVYASPMADDLV